MKEPWRSLTSFANICVFFRIFDAIISELDDKEAFLLFFWLSSPEMAELRVAKRVAAGGHDPQRCHPPPLHGRPQKHV